MCGVFVVKETFMARDSSGPKNEPNYSGLGAPADAADLTEVATYAARMGNRRTDTSTNRAAATGADLWEGLEWQETDTGNTLMYLSGSWVLIRSSAAILVTTFGTNWTSASPTAATCYRQGNRVDLVGTVLFGASGGGGSYSNILTVPASVQPPTATQRFLGTTLNSAGAAIELVMTSGLISSAAGYNINSLGFGARVPLHCFWYLD